MSSYPVEIIFSGTCTVACVESVTVLQETISEIHPAVPVTDLIGETLILCPCGMSSYPVEITVSGTCTVACVESVTVLQETYLRDPPSRSSDRFDR